MQRSGHAETCKDVHPGLALSCCPAREQPGSVFYRAGELSVLSGALVGNLAMLWSVSPCIPPDDQSYLSAGYTVQGMSNVMKVARVGCAEVRSASIEKNIVTAG